MVFPKFHPCVQLPVWSVDRCEARLANLNTSTIVCAGGEAGKSTCNGDSGGPLVAPLEGLQTLVGVVSFGYVVRTVRPEGLPEHVWPRLDGARLDPGGHPQRLPLWLAAVQEHYTMEGDATLECVWIYLKLIYVV